MKEEQIKNLEQKIRLAERTTYFVEDENAKQALELLREAIVIIAKEVCK